VFLDEEQRRYRDQLERLRPVVCAGGRTGTVGLYFPLLDQWRELGPLAAAKFARLCTMKQDGGDKQSTATRHRGFYCVGGRFDSNGRDRVDSPTILAMAPPGLGILGVATSAIAALGSLGLLPIVIGGLYGKFSRVGQFGKL